MVEDKLVLTVSEVQRILGLSKNKAYEFVTSDECPFRVIKLGRLYRIPAKDFYSWIQGTLTTK